MTSLSSTIRSRVAQRAEDSSPEIQKTKASGSSPDRDAQFQNLADLIETYNATGNPVFSVDTKAKEFLGRLFRQGRSWCSQAPVAFDHDFPAWAGSVLFPHGIYDPVRNPDHINLGLSHDTSEFACQSLRWYWNRIGRQRDPHAESILPLFDGGGSNAANKFIVKDDLQQLDDSIGLPIRVAHDPSYCSECNPIERRLLPHLSRSCSGHLFDMLERAVQLMRSVTTRIVSETMRTTGSMRWANER